MEERLYYLLEKAEDIMSQLYHNIPPSRKKRVNELADEYFELYDEIQLTKKKYRLVKRRVNKRTSACGLI